MFPKHYILFYPSVLSKSRYAKIWSERIPLYQRLGRELMRLVPLERFLWSERDEPHS